MNAAPSFPTPDTGPRSGLGFLRNSVADYFRANGVAAEVAPVGLKYRSFTLGQSVNGANRIVFIPGEFDGNPTPKPRKYGALSRETRNTASVGNPRELLHWARPLTLSVWAAPVAGAGEREDMNITVAEDLLEQVVRAVTYAASTDGTSLAASIVWGEVTINSPPVENGFGVELLVAATQMGPLFDVTYDVVQAGPALTKGYA